MKHTIITLTLLAWPCLAMEQAVKARPKDPLAWAQQLIASEDPPKEDMQACKAELDKKMPIAKINAIELAHKSVTEGEKALKIQKLEEDIKKQATVLDGFQGIEKMYRRGLEQAEQWLSEHSGSSNDEAKQEIDEVDEKEREKVLLTEMISILTRHIFAQEEATGDLIEERDNDYRSVFEHLSTLLVELDISPVLVREKQESSSEEEFVTTANGDEVDVQKEINESFEKFNAASLLLEEQQISKHLSRLDCR